MPRKTRRQRGSAYIYKGAYGCVFGKPPLKCQGEPTRRNDKYVSKVMTQRNAHDEIRDGDKFRQLDPTKDYFLWPESQCEMDKTATLPLNGVDECTSLGPLHTTLLFSENGGQDLNNFSLNYDLAPEFFESLINIFNGLEMAHASGVFHCDIKSGNIVTLLRPDRTYHTRFIDFGLSMSTRRLEQADFDLFGSNYVYWPFETRFYNKYYMAHKWIIGNKTPEFEAYMKKVNEYRRKILPEYTYWTSNGQNRYDASSMDKVIQGLNLTNLPDALVKLDIYSLGITLSEIYYRFTNHNVKKNDVTKTKYVDLSINLLLIDPAEAGEIIQWNIDVQNQISIPLADLIYDMIHILPARRPSIAVARSRFMAILPAIRALFSKRTLFKSLKSTGVLGLNPVSPQPPPPTPFLSPTNLGKISTSP